MILKGDHAVPVILSSTVTLGWMPKKQAENQAKRDCFVSDAQCYKGVTSLSLVMKGRQRSDCVGVILHSESCKTSLKFFVVTSHRMVGVGRDLSGSSSPTPLPKQGHLQQAAQELVQVGFEYLQRIRLWSS